LRLSRKSADYASRLGKNALHRQRAWFETRFSLAEALLTMK